MEVSKDRLRKTYPNISREIDHGVQSVRVDSLRSNINVGEKKATTHKDLANYDPDVIDFLRRCDNKKQAEEIIEYMESRSEISPSYAEKLRTQLRKKGVRSFGPKKEQGHYYSINR